MTDVAIDEQKVIDATGHGREHWYSILDGYGDVDHTTRTKRLSADAPDLDGWWVQMLTVDYERDRGLRVVGQSCAGDFQVSCSKTLPGDPLEVQERLLATPLLANGSWHPGARFAVDGHDIEVRRVDEKMVRWFWHDDDGRSTVEASLDGRASGKTTLTIRHHGLASNDARETYRARWKELLEAVDQ